MEGAKLPIHELQQLLASMASIIKDNTTRLEGIAATVDRIVASPFDLTSSRGMAEARAEAATSPTTTPDVATTTTSTKLVAASLVCSADPHDVAPPSSSHTAAPIHTSELDVDLPTKCATTGLDHDIGRNLAAATYPCTGCVAATPGDATPTPARRPAAVFELDKWTHTRCLMLGSGTDTFDDTIAATSPRLRAECTAIPVPSEAPPFMVLSPFTVLEFDAPPHTIDSSNPSGAPSRFPSPSTAVAATCVVVPPTGVESSRSNSTKFSPSSTAVSEVPLASTDCSMQVRRQDSNTLLADNVQLCLNFWSPFRLSGFVVQYRSPWPPPMQCGCSTIFSEFWCISPFWPLPWLPPVHNSSKSRFTKSVQEFLWSIPLHMISAVTLEQLLASVQGWQLNHGTPLLKCNFLLIMGARQATCARVLSYDSGRVHINIQFNRWPKLFSLLFYLSCCCTPLTARDEDLQLPPIGVTVVLPPPAKPLDSADILFHACSYWVFLDDGAALPYSTIYASAFDSKQEPWFRLLFTKFSPAQITIFFLEDCTSSAGTCTTEKQCGASDRWDCRVVLNISVLFHFARSSAVELDTNFMVCNCSPLSPHWMIKYAPVIKFHNMVGWLSEGSIGNFFAFRPYSTAHVGHHSDELVAGNTPIPMQLTTHSEKHLLVHFVVQRPDGLNMFEERCPASKGIRPFDTKWSGGVLTLLAMHRFNSGNLLILILWDPGDCYWSNLVVYVGCGACKLALCPVFRMAVIVRVLVLDDLLPNLHKSSLRLVTTQPMLHGVLDIDFIGCDDITKLDAAVFYEAPKVEVLSSAQTNFDGLGAELRPRPWPSFVCRHGREQTELPPNQAIALLLLNGHPSVEALLGCYNTICLMSKHMGVASGDVTGFSVGKMKFGSIYVEYLRAEQDKYLAKCSHVEYKSLKKVLKRCRLDRSLQADGTNGDQQEDRSDEFSDACDCNSCTLWDQKFFTELTKEASDIACYFSSRVHLRFESSYLMVWKIAWMPCSMFTDRAYCPQCTSSTGLNHWSTVMGQPSALGCISLFGKKKKFKEGGVSCLWPSSSIKSAPATSTTSTSTKSVPTTTTTSSLRP